jgi:hypothetical protein
MRPSHWYDFVFHIFVLVVLGAVTAWTGVNIFKLLRYLRNDIPPASWIDLAVPTSATAEVCCHLGGHGARDGLDEGRVGLHGGDDGTGIDLEGLPHLGGDAVQGGTARPAVREVAQALLDTAVWDVPD